MKRNGGGRYDSGDNAKRTKVDSNQDSHSQVLFIGSLPNDATESDVVQLGLAFGRMTAMIMNKKKNQAFLEMASLDTAESMVNYYTERPPKIGGRTVHVRFSNYDRLKMEDNAQNALCIAALKAADVVLDGNEAPRAVLRIIIDNMLYPITVEILHKIFSKFGQVLRIVTFTKNNQFHAFVEYSNSITATAAKSSLNGQNIYNGCCTLRIDYSKLDKLTVKYNNDKMWDFTNSSLPSGDGHAGADGMMNSMQGMSGMNMAGFGASLGSNKKRQIGGRDYDVDVEDNGGMRASSGSGMGRSGAGTGNMTGFNAMSGIGGNVGGLNQNMSGMIGNMSAMTGNMGAMAGSLNSLTGNMGGMAGNLANLAGNMGGMTGNLGGMAGNFAGMGGNLGGMAGMIGNMGMGTMANNMGGMSGNMGMMAAGMAGMSGNMGGMLGNLAGISNTMSGMTGGMGNMMGNMGALGGNMNRMTGSMNNTGGVPSLMGNIPGMIGGMTGNLGALGGTMGAGIMAGVGNMSSMAGGMSGIGGMLQNSGNMMGGGMMGVMSGNMGGNLAGMGMMGGKGGMDRGNKGDTGMKSGKSSSGKREDNRGDHGGSGNTCVVLVSNMDEKRITPDNIFTLFGVYGDVMRVKILFNKKDSALIEYSDPEQAQFAVTHLNRVTWWGKEIRVSKSKHQHIMEAKEGVAQAWLTKDYSKSTLHRFRNPNSKNYNNIFSPSATLHLSNIPPDVTEEMLRDLFGEYGKVVAFKFFQKDRRMGLIQMASVEDGISALIELHNYELGPRSHLRVSFTQSTIKD